MGQIISQFPGGGENVKAEVAEYTGLVDEFEGLLTDFVGLPEGADATAGDILLNKKAYVGQELVVGTFDKDAFAEAQKNGQYVWKKYETADKQQFIAYVVSDDPDTYPDGDTQDGYYYEKDIQKSSGTVTLASRSKSISFYHGLTGEVAYILTKNDEITVSVGDYVGAAYPMREQVSTAEITGTYTGIAAFEYTGSGNVYSPESSDYFTQNNENKTVTITASSSVRYVFQSGKYIWYAMKM